MQLWSSAPSMVKLCIFLEGTSGCLELGHRALVLAAWWIFGYIHPEEAVIVGSWGFSWRWPHLGTFWQPQSHKWRARTCEYFLPKARSGQHITVSTTLQIPPASFTPTPKTSPSQIPSILHPSGFMLKAGLGLCNFHKSNFHWLRPP